MAKQRPSVHKRQREHLKRQRELRKAEKAAQKRERRLNRDREESAASPEDVDKERGAETESTDPAE